MYGCFKAVLLSTRRQQPSTSQPGCPPTPRNGCSILSPTCTPRHAKPLSWYPALHTSLPLSRSLMEGQMSSWWQDLFVLPREKQLSKQPLCWGEGQSLAALASLHGWSSTAWSPAHHVFLLEALLQLRHSQNWQKDLIVSLPILLMVLFCACFLQSQCIWD